MKLVAAFMAVLTLPQILLSQKLDSVQSAAVLQKFDQHQSSVQSVFYQVSFKSVNDGVEDSVFSTSADVWIAYQPADTIFGARFHVSGEDKSGSFDYYYDGISGLEARHRDKQLYIFNPYAFPNNDNNPAKARTALNGLHPLLIRKNIVDYLLVNYPYAGKPRVEGERRNGEYHIALKFPVSKIGQQSEMFICLDDRTYRLKSTKRVTVWNGVTFTTDHIVREIKENDLSSVEKLVLTESFEGYARKDRFTPGDKSAASNEIAAGRDAPIFSYQDFAGKQYDLKQFRGKYVLLDFWETWCGHCIVSFPAVKDLYQTFRSKGFEVLGVTTENQSRIPALIRANNLDYPNLRADRAILENYRVSARPTYVLIDREGKVAAYSHGDLEQIRKLLERL